MKKMLDKQLKGDGKLPLSDTSKAKEIRIKDMSD